MKCSIHSDREALSSCETCGVFFCEGCLIDVEDKFFCKNHVAVLIRNNHRPPKYSHHYHNHYNFSSDYPYKSRIVALLLCIFLGYLGIHRFYTGKVGTGILYLFTGGLFVFGWFFDILRIVSGGFLDANARPLR